MTDKDMTDENTGDENAETAGGKRGALLKKAAALVLLVAVAGGVYWAFGDYLKLEALAAREAQLRDFGQKRPVLLVAAATAIYILATGLSLPGAALLTLVYGWLFPTIFGFWPGLVLTIAVVSFSSAAGATIAFLLSRYLFRDLVRKKFPDRVAAFDKKFEEDGPLYLFTLRLIAGVPFFVVNVGMGLTPIRTLTYWWVSQLGMFPGTLVYCYAGSQFPSLADLSEQGVGGILDWKLGVAFAVLGVFPLIVKKLYQKFGPNTDADADADAPADADPPAAADSPADADADQTADKAD